MPVSPAPLWLRALIPVVIVAATLAAFWPTLDNGLLEWDDRLNLIDNDAYRGFGWTQLRWMFTTFHGGHYQPLSWLTYSLDHYFWGLDARGFHLTNLILHAANVVLFYWLAMRLLRLAMPGRAGGTGLHISAALAAAVFALHPLRVESVAWATERRDVLSGLFFLLTLLAYLGMNRLGAGRRVAWLVATPALYAMALLSKVMIVTLPVILIVLDVYPLRRLGPGRWFDKQARGVWLEKLPFFLLALAFVVVAPMAAGSAVHQFEKYGLGPRVTQTLYSLAFYPYKTLLPTGLSPLYQLVVREVHLSNGRFLASAVVVAAVTAALVALRRRWPAGLAMWVCYAVILTPVSGLVQNGPQITADRYSYLSCLGLELLMGALLLRVWHAAGNRRATNVVLAATCALGAVGCAALAALTFRQVHFWHDTRSLWTRAVEARPHARIARFNLGNALVREGDISAAIEHYRIAAGRGTGHIRSRINLANALIATGRLAEAVSQLEAILARHPDRVDVCYNLANVLASLGRSAEAAARYRQVLRIAPGSQKVRYNLGLALMRDHRYREAIAEFRLIPPKSAVYLPAASNLARILATCPDGAIRNGTEAVALAEQLCRATNHADAEVLSVLATAYAEVGRFTDAVGVARRAIETARARGQDSLAKRTEQLLELYQAGRAYHESK